MGILDTFIDVNKSFFEAGDRAIEAKVGPKTEPEMATCCGNCLNNIIAPPHVCRIDGETILDPYRKLKTCPYRVDG